TEWEASGRLVVPTLAGKRGRTAGQAASEPAPALVNTPAPDAVPPGITVAELLAAWLRHARGYYRTPDGEPAGGLHNYTHSLRPLTPLYAALPAAEFSPLKLKAVRRLMVEGYLHPEHGEQEALARTNVNRRVGRIKHVFSWAVSEELVPASVYQAL